MKTMQYYEWERFYRFTEERIVKSPENWQDFLGSMAYRYLLPFWQQIGIYFQKPDAVELDTYTGWKNKGRQVVRNSKSISLFSHNGNNVLRLFDISSTRSVSKNIPEFSVWTISEKEAVYLREQLGSLDDLLMNTLQNNKDMYKSFIIESVKFIINERCDFSLLSVDDKVFENLPKSVNDLHRVGATISFSSNEMLEKIEKTLADYKKIEYDIIRDNISKNNKEVAKNGRNEIDIPTGRGLLSSEYNIPRNRGGGANNKVGNDEVNIYSGKETSVLSAVVPNRSDSETFSRNSAEGEEDGRRTDSENGENRGSKRGIESQRPNEMGSVDEQYSQQGSGNSESRSNIQLNLFDDIKNKEQNQKGSALLSATVKADEHSTTKVQYIRYTNEEIEVAKTTNLVNFLQHNGENLKRVGINEYTMENHDSMRINIQTNEYFWNSQNISGAGAVDFCMKYYNMTFSEAVGILLSFNGYIKGKYNIPSSVSVPKVEVNKKAEEKPANQLPNPLDTKTNRIYAYLTKTRGIDTDIVHQLIKEEKIAQDIKGNLVFKIFDPTLSDKLSGAEITGTLTEHRYKQYTERNGNGFTINPTGEKPEGAIFFEAAIDLLSFYNLHKDTKALLVSMAGLKDKVVLKTMKDYSLNPRFCYISSDNDEAGVKFASKMQDEYGVSVYRVTDDKRFDKYSNIKDWNDLLKAEKNSVQFKENEIFVKPVQDLQEDAVGSADNSIQNHQNSKYEFLEKIKVGSYIKYDNDIWKIGLIADGDKNNQDRNLIRIDNIREPDMMLPIFDDWKSVFKAELDNENLKYLPIGEMYSEENVNFYKLGDFFEAFNEDAILISEILNLVLTHKNINGYNIPMVGIPYHSLENYVIQLTEHNIGVGLDTYDNFLKTYQNNKDIIGRTINIEDGSNTGLSIRSFLSDNDVYKANYEYNGIVDMGVVWQQGENYYISTGSAREHNLEFHYFTPELINNFVKFVNELTDVDKIQVADVVQKKTENEQIDLFDITSTVKSDSLKFYIGFTENGILQNFITDNEISFALGNSVLKYLDTKAEVEYNGGYDKTDFVINTVIDGEKFDYKGRFDIGSEYRSGCDGLTGHIEEYYKYQLDRNPNNLSREELNNCRDIINTLVPFLKSHEQMTLSEQEIFENFCAENPIEENNIITDFKSITNKQFNNIGDLSSSDIEELAKEHIQSVLAENNIDASIINIALTGSRSRGLENESSDIDIVVEYKGDVKEDFLFNIFNESGFNIEGIAVDINPITEYQTGTLESYLPLAEKFLDDKKNQTQHRYKIPDIVIDNMPDETITIEERNNYGYKSDYLLPLKADKAIDLFENYNLPVYRLYDDDTEGLVENVEEIKNFNGIFGIETFDWVKYLEALKNIEIDDIVQKETNESEIVEEIADNNNLDDKQITSNEALGFEYRMLSRLKSDCDYFLGNGNRNLKWLNGNDVNKHIDEMIKLYNKFPDNLKPEWISLEDIESYRIQMISNETELNAVQAEKSTITASEITANINLVIQNHKIKDTEVVNYTPKEKYRNNVAAIRTLKAIENEDRTATAEEQEILAKYVGWGGLSDAFDVRKTAWTSEYAELNDLLTSDEYTAARSSTLNAHYTSPIIVKAMYNGLDNMGFKKGKILEPAMGTGNFFGTLPENMRGSKLYGVELDSITGRIAKQLYPNAHIEIKGFEKTSFQSNFFDVAIGNVPFGNYKLYDSDFKSGDLIHDYFFKKALDKVRPGGVVAFITSKGTLDKKDSSVRQYLAERSELLGAVRLPNNAFANANTEVTSDIIFLQKRDRLLNLTEDNMPEWVNLSADEKGIEMNSYFVNHKEMILGDMIEVSGRFGIETTCKPFEGADLSVQLEKVVQNIKGTIIQDNVMDTLEEFQNINTDIIAEDYRNFCYTVIDGDIYYRENDNMIKQDITGKRAERIKGMVEVSETLRSLISAQRDDLPDNKIKILQNKLNAVYDDFTAKYGLLSDKQNKSVFRDDDTSALLLSLENLDNDGNLESKADIFTKRTIVPYVEVTNVCTSSEALVVSISEKAHVDLDYMSQLCSKPKEEIIKDLEGIIFENPITGKFENADEYLSGNVKEKLKIASEYAKNDSKYDINVKSLRAVQPEDLKPSEISAQLGSTWIPAKYYQQFMYELLDTPYWNKEEGKNDAFGKNNNLSIIIDFDNYSSTYGISNRTADSSNVKANTTYGTSRMNAYRIIEATLNLKPVRVFDYIEDEKGNKKAVLNNKETLLAQEKQSLIKDKFKEWVFDDYERTQDLCNIYNEKFNAIRPREYDGSHITFKGINPEISLRKHQTDAIAHTLYGGNTLFAHSVGAGKSFEMIASAMESKRLGLCNKSMIVVPKSIVNQMAREFLQLYPTANILVPTERDFSKENRQKFCSRIATGNYDAIIISHNQLEKIPLSAERQKNFIEGQIKEVEEYLLALHSDPSTSRGFTIKQMESSKKNLKSRLEKLNNDSRRDTVITFEELGVDKLYVDEAHFFKNKYFNTKMDRVAGINSGAASQRAEDLFMKCRYLDEKTNSKGVVFATGTPISNSMVEMYTMQTYLQYDELKKLGLNHFDAWASTFGETQIALELAPEGKGYQMKTRFSKFFNLPELMNTFKNVADIKTGDILNLPVPKANYHTIATDASRYQKDLVDGLAVRAEAIRAKKVDKDEDNMLNITNDGRKLALDQRLANSLLPDDPNSKVNVCISNVFDIWQQTAESKSTQMIFCDLSTPHYDSSFNVYDDIKQKLIAKGIPETEIAFIHDCKTDEQKLKLFTKVQDGNVRVLLGSTNKLGTGTNCQNKLKAVHHLDCPYRPADLEQRNGRIVRQGNENPEVDIYNYVTKGTFDAYLYQLVENKQKFISQIMTSKSPARSAEDIDECVLSYAEIKALAAGDPKIKEKMDLDIEVNRLRTVFASYQENKRLLQENIAVKYPEKIQKINEYICVAKKDAELVEMNTSKGFPGMTVNNVYFSDKKDAGTAFLESCSNIRPDEETKLIGEYRGFKMEVSFDSFRRSFVVNLRRNLSYSTDIGTDVFGNITRLDNLLNSIDKKLEDAQSLLEKTKYQLEAAKKEVNVPFPQLEELRKKESRLNKLNKELSIDNQTENKNIVDQYEEGQQINGLKDFVEKAKKELDGQKTSKFQQHNYSKENIEID